MKQKMLFVMMAVAICGWLSVGEAIAVTGTVEYNDALVSGSIYFDVAGVAYGPTSDSLRVENIGTGTLVQVNYPFPGDWSKWRYNGNGQWVEEVRGSHLPIFFVDPNDPSVLTTMPPGTVKYNDALANGVLDIVDIGGNTTYNRTSAPFTVGNIPATNEYRGSKAKFLYKGNWDNWTYGPGGWIREGGAHSVPIFFVDPNDPSVLTTMPPGTVKYNDALANGVLQFVNIGGDYTTYTGTSAPFTVGNIPVITNVDLKYLNDWDKWTYGTQGWVHTTVHSTPIFFVDSVDSSILTTAVPGTVEYKGALGEGGVIEYADIGGVIFQNQVDPFVITDLPATNTWVYIKYLTTWSNWRYDMSGQWVEEIPLHPVPIFFVDPVDSSVLTTIFVALSPRILDVNPNTLNVNSNGKWITAYISGGNFELIDANSLRLKAVPADTTVGGLVDMDNDGEVDAYMAKFPRDIVSSGLSAGRDVELTLTGTINSGEVSFTLTDKIDVISGGRSGSHGKSQF